jgi:hypothetical protein
MFVLLSLLLKNERILISLAVLGLSPTEVTRLRFDQEKKSPTVGNGKHMYVLLSLLLKN